MKPSTIFQRGYVKDRNWTFDCRLLLSRWTWRGRVPGRRSPRHLNYEKPSADDRDFIEKRLRTLPSKNGTDAVSSRIFCGYDLDSPEGLVSALSRANAIPENAGIKYLKTNIFIQSEDIKERQHVIEQETLRLRKANQLMRAHLEGYLHHKSRITDALRRVEGEKALMEGRPKDKVIRRQIKEPCDV